MCVTLSDAIFTQYPQANSPVSWVKLSSFMSHELEKFLSWITPAYEPMNLGVHSHTPWTCGQNGTVLLCSCAFTTSPLSCDMTWCNQKMCTCVAFTRWELKFWQSHFRNAKLKSEIKCDGMRQLWIDLLTFTKAPEAEMFLRAKKRHCFESLGWFVSSNGSSAEKISMRQK